MQHVFYGDLLHAIFLSLITLAMAAGAAVDIPGDNNMVFSAGSPDSRGCWSEKGNDRDTHSRGNVHWSAVIRDKQSGLFDQCRQLKDGGLAGFGIGGCLHLRKDSPDILHLPSAAGDDDRESQIPLQGV